MSHDTVIHKIVRPAVRRIATTRTTPNQITTLRLATGLAAAGCFAAGTRGWLVAGALVFLVSMLLDRADGELARQTGQMSLAGYRYDLASDCIAGMTAFIGLGIGLATGHGAVAVWLGGAAGVGIGLLFAELNLWGLMAVRGHEMAPGLTVDPDDAMALVPLLILLGLAWPMTVAAAIITPLAALAVAGIAFSRRARR